MRDEFQDNLQSGKFREGSWQILLSFGLIKDLKLNKILAHAPFLQEKDFFLQNFRDANNDEKEQTCKLGKLAKCVTSSSGRT